MSSFWSNWVLILTLSCLILIVYILLSTWKIQRKETTEETVDHDFDGIKEYDNPMPMWWIGLFVGTLIFGVIYFVLYPGIWPDKFDGLLGWSSTEELKKDQLRHSRQFQPIFEQYAATSIEELQENPKVLGMGKRIFLSNCATCHGSDGGGAFGFPRLNDNNWLWGGNPEDIKTAVLYGRRGQMPAWGPILGVQGVKDTAAYTRYLGGLDVSENDGRLDNGKTVYESMCAVCHGLDGTGNKLLGAPNLTDDSWVYGNTQVQVEYTIRKGRNGVMPAWLDILGPEKSHIVSAYVYSLSREQRKLSVSETVSENIEPTK